MADEDLKEELARLKRSFAEQREQEKVRDDILESLRKLNSAQALRWELLKDIGEHAVNQCSEMRDTAHENPSDSDQGLPAWLSVIMSLAITFVPISAVTAAFLTALAGGGRRTELAARIARLERIPKPKRWAAARKVRDAQAWAKKELEAIDRRVASFAKNRSPELANFLQERADELAQGIGKFLYQLAHPTRGAATTYERTSAPSVVLTQSLNSWIYATRKEDNLEQDDLIKNVRARYETSIEPDPPPPAKTLKPKAARQAREKNAEAKEKKDIAKRTLLEIRDALALTPEDIADPPELKQLEDLQIAIELLIWCTTYNFALVHRDIMSPTSHGERWKLGEQVHAPQLPGNLWKQFKDRYADTLLKVPTFGWRVQFEGFEVTMSEYFGYLHSNLSQENGELIRKFSNLKPAKPGRP